MSPPLSTERVLNRRIDELDASLFDHIEVQLDFEDRRSLLALHVAARTVYRAFCWLEIGSHLGGSLQVLVRDPLCTGIVSIDPRPAQQKDERGSRYHYPGNSTDRMLSALAGVPEANVSKVRTFEATTSELAPSQLASVPQVCFVDGEHTDEAALSDAMFCRAAMSGVGCIAFHDSPIVYQAISSFLGQLDGEFRAYFLANSIFVVELGPARLLATAQVTDAVLNNYKGYLFGLQSNSYYRAFYNWPLFRVVRMTRGTARSVRKRRDRNS